MPEFPAPLPAWPLDGDPGAAPDRARRVEGHPRDDRVTAVLGPTNTGKTHYAIERMLAHRSGVMGLPLRLLAREIYDRIVALRGPSAVSLVTGEEKIVPPRSQYWICTVEAMPLEQGADFVAVDEIQLCADPDRGHVFTDRLLHARGLHETLFLGAEAMRPRIAELIPRARFMRRDRLSTLTYAGPKKLGRMPSRSAIVGFSADSVYAIAELMRRQRGGAAVVMGALSPRTRNAQVELYQNGDVDHLVATDAIGMGLNLDVRHVAFSGLSKFDGRRHRPLWPGELAQIAGRAGRHLTNGSFGVTGEAPNLDAETVEAIESHRFPTIRRLSYRNSRLRFGSVPALIASLEQAPDLPGLMRAREADDLAALRRMQADPRIGDMARGGPQVRRLWEVCQIPDFRKTGDAEHAGLIAEIYRFLLSDKACISSDWINARIARVDRSDGDIDALSTRLAFIRTWTYVANRRDWVEDAARWREAARDVEDRLSDALHARLTQRFVDRRTSVLMRRLKQKESLVAEVNDKGEVTAEGHALGRLDGFRFTQDPEATGDEAKTLRAASTQALETEFRLRADKFYNAPDTELDMTDQGGLMWGEHAVGKLVAGADPLSPGVEGFVDEIAGEDVRQKVERRLIHWINRRIAAHFEPLIKLRDDETVTGLARGIAFQLVEALGVIPRAEISRDVKELDQDGRGMLRRHGVRFGQHTIFMPLLLKPAPTRLRLALWGLAEGQQELCVAPPPGLVTIPAVEGAPKGFYPRAGYRLAGQRAIRIDMLERLADMIRTQDTRGGFEAAADMLSITGCTLEQFADLMQGLGYRAERGERPKPAPIPQQPAASAKAGAGSEAGAGDAPGAKAPDTPDSPTGSAAAATEAGREAPTPDGAAPDGDSATATRIEAGSDAETTPVPATDEAPASAPDSAPSAEPPEAPAPEVRKDPETQTDPAAQPGPGAAGAKPDADAPDESSGAGADAKPEAEAEAGAAPETDAETGAESGQAPDKASAKGPETDSAKGSAKDSVDLQVFYTFTWAPRQGGRGRGRRNGEDQDNRQPSRGQTRGGQTRGAQTRDAEGKRQGGGKKPGGKPRGRSGDDRKPNETRKHAKGKPRNETPRTYTARPPKSEKPIDPDNPFAALMALKTKR